MTIYYDTRARDYGTPGHPESPERMTWLQDAFAATGEHTFKKPKEALESDLALVHTKAHITAVRDNSFIDRDTPNIDGIYDHARRAVGGAIAASEAALEQRIAFSLMRPPGHHAGKESIEGFCYFNNIAVASMRLATSGRRVAVLDIDVHHGNGTQDILRGRDDVIFCSLQELPLYPGTGWDHEDNCYNYPLRAGMKIDAYVEELEKALGKIRAFNPDILGVSLGLDTYVGDPLAQIALEIADYVRVGEAIRSLDLPTFVVLEGGYSQDIGACAVQFFKGLNS